MEYSQVPKSVQRHCVRLVNDGPPPTGRTQRGLLERLCLQINGDEDGNVGDLRATQKD